MRSRLQRLVRQRRKAGAGQSFPVGRTDIPAEAASHPRVLSEGADDRHDRQASWRFTRKVYRGLALDHAVTSAVITVSVLAFWAGVFWLGLKMLMR